MPEPVTRRRVLVGAVAVSVVPFGASGCTSGNDEPVTDPDRLALESALNVEVTLHRTLQGLARGDAATQDAATQGVQAVDAHVTALSTALNEALEASPSSSASGTPEETTTTVGDAVRAADHAADQHRRALRSASAEISPLLASIAASDAAVAALLRSGAP
ncbi:MAG TPA: hypothetical protein VFX15_09225 [Actinomycetes bacterium]|nr:hypothetical protein [Actinomycetes bacterium]